MKYQKSPFAQAGVAVVFGVLFATAGARATPQDFPDQEIRAVASGNSAEGIYIVTANADSSVDGCGTRFLLEAGNPLLNQNLALALSAFYAHSRVHLQVDGCQGSEAMRLKSIRITR